MVHPRKLFLFLKCNRCPVFLLLTPIFLCTIVWAIEWFWMCTLGEAGGRTHIFKIYSRIDINFARENVDYYPFCKRKVVKNICIWKGGTRSPLRRPFIVTERGLKWQKFLLLSWSFASSENYCECSNLRLMLTFPGINLMSYLHGPVRLQI